jgi:hypothetical protein
MKIKKFYAVVYLDRIEEVEFDRETTGSVFKDGRREQKIIPGYRGYFDTWEEARQFKIDTAEQKIIVSKAQLKRYEEELQRIKEIKHDKMPMG